MVKKKFKKKKGKTSFGYSRAVCCVVKYYIDNKMYIPVKTHSSVKQTPLEERGSKAQSERETRGEYQKAIIQGREMRVWLTSREVTPSRFTTNQLIAGKLCRSCTIELLHKRTLARLCSIRNFEQVETVPEVPSAQVSDIMWVVYGRGLIFLK